MAAKKELADRQMLVQREEIRRLEESSASSRREAAALREQLERQRDAVEALQQVWQRPAPLPDCLRSLPTPHAPRHSRPVPPATRPHAPSRPPVLGLPRSHPVRLEVASAPVAQGLGPFRARSHIHLDQLVFPWPPQVQLTC